MYAWFDFSRYVLCMHGLMLSGCRQHGVAQQPGECLTPWLEASPHTCCMELNISSSYPLGPVAAAYTQHRAWLTSRDARYEVYVPHTTGAQLKSMHVRFAQAEPSPGGTDRADTLQDSGTGDDTDTERDADTADDADTAEYAGDADNFDADDADDADTDADTDAAADVGKEHDADGVADACSVDEIGVEYEAEAEAGGVGPSKARGAGGASRTEHAGDVANAADEAAVATVASEGGPELRAAEPCAGSVARGSVDVAGTCAGNQTTDARSSPEPYAAMTRNAIQAVLKSKGQATLT